MITASSYDRGDYDFLYANYLGHDRLAKAVRERCDSHPPRVALDLCAGTGAMVETLVHLRTPRVIAIDKSSAMLDRIPSKLEPYGRLFSQVETWKLDLNQVGSLNALLAVLPDGVDLITCRQGVGYLTPQTLARIPTLLSPGGAFLFNTFAQPNQKPWCRKSGEGIYEAGVFLGHKVFHLQFRWPKVDFTSFRWHNVNKDLVPAWIDKGLKVQVKQSGRSLLVAVTHGYE